MLRVGNLDFRLDGNEPMVSPAEYGGVRRYSFCGSAFKKPDPSDIRQKYAITFQPEALRIPEAVSASELLLEVRDAFRVLLVEGFLQRLVQVLHNMLQCLGRIFWQEGVFIFPLRQQVRQALVAQAVFAGRKALFLERKRLVPDKKDRVCLMVHVLVKFTFLDDTYDSLLDCPTRLKLTEHITY